MIDLLQKAAEFETNPQNPFCPEAILKYSDSVINSSSSADEVFRACINKGNAFLELGEEQKAVDFFEALLNKTSPLDFERRNEAMKFLAISYLRLGEKTNCIQNHSPESCIYPISAGGVHADKTGSEKAIEVYKKILTDNPADLESRWLLNIAYMTVGRYPNDVPPAFLMNVDNEDSFQVIKPFHDVASNMGLNIKEMAGGSIVEDFNNDDYLDIVTSSWGLKEPMYYCRNNQNGTYTDVSDSSGLGYLTGGLNIMQTDYNNDGYKDIFVLRGAWRMEFGKTPNSLLRNNGDGTFTDVTVESGLLSFHPTQTATWADFNNDGWLDLFIGNESLPTGEVHPCELFINNMDGTFNEVAENAGCAITKFVKGVISGDFNNDFKNRKNSYFFLHKSIIK